MNAEQAPNPGRSWGLKVPWRKGVRRRHPNDGLPASIVEPGYGRYVDLARGMNERWKGNPEQIRLASRTHHVLAAVQDAVANDKRIAVRSGGHCYEGFVDNPEVQIVVDVSQLNEIGYDARHNAISVGAGALLPAVYTALYRIWGVTIPGGSCGTVAVGGHIVGGGYGLLSRRHGLTVDYLYGVEVVVVDRRGRARVLVATRDASDPNHDLWWAHTGGGGGNFGIVTRFLLKDPAARGTNPAKFLPKPPSKVLLSAVALDWADVDERAFTRLVRNFGDWHEDNSGPRSKYAGLFGLLKLNKKTFDKAGNPTGQIVLLTQADATVPKARELLDDYLDAVFGGIDIEQRAWQAPSGEHEPLPQYLEPRAVPWLRATLELGGAPTNRRGDYKSAYLRKGHTDRQIAATYKWLSTREYNNPDALVQIDSYGCKVNTVASDATAVPQRDSVLKLQYQVYWADPEEDDWHLAWLRGFYRDVYADTGGVPAPGDVTDGCFINYPDIDLSDPEWNTSDVAWSTLYYKDNYRRLQEVKRRYDPLGIFRHAQSIEPS